MVGLQIASNEIKPRDSEGNLDPTNGTVAMISIGMSNTTHEFGSGSRDGGGPEFAFQSRATADPAKNPFLNIVDGAQDGADATLWTNANASTWIALDQRLIAAGVTSNQVQVAWLKLALKQPAEFGGFPAHAQVLQAMLETVVRIAKARFPNLRLGFVSSRTRAYTDDPTTRNPEPYAYESGFAVKWMIEGQIRGTNNLNFNPNIGPVVAPWLAWGPYLWADGTTPRSDGLVWRCSDVRPDDFLHPSTPGVAVVAGQLLAFFKTDPVATPWFLKATLTPPVRRNAITFCESNVAFAERAAISAAFGT